MKILMAGGTGFIGGPVAAALEAEGHDAVLLSRRRSGKTRQGLRSLEWNGRTLGSWAEEVETADAVINLAGEPVAGKWWTAAQKEKIAGSRIDATRVLVEAIASASCKPAVLINASAVGYYGHVPGDEVSEAQPQGAGFLAELCGRWEETAMRAERFGVRVVLLRFGIVLGEKGGALSRMVAPFRFFLGTCPGSGDQGVSWIHLRDVERIVLFALENEPVAGPVNATAPGPVTMRDFCNTLGEVLNRPSRLSVPEIVLKLLCGEMSAMFLEGQKAIPRKLLDQQFSFAFPGLRNALEDILRNKKDPGSP